MILNGMNNYCASIEMKKQLGTLGTEDVDCENKDTFTTEEIRKMVNLGNAEVIEIEYRKKITWLKVKSNGYIYSLQENAMVEGNLDKPKAEYAVGDLLKVQVSDSETQNIYVLEVNDEEIVGILDRNLTGGTVVWISKGDYNSAGGDWTNDDGTTKNNNLYNFGPITALTALNERTSSWNKVTKKYLPEAEDILKLTEYYKELEASGETTNWESKYFTDFDGFSQANESVLTCSSGSECREAITTAGGGKYLLPEWATINLKTTGDSSAGWGYWTSTPMNYSVVSDPDNAWDVLGNGFLDDVPVVHSGGDGVRPVIHIYESNILEKLEAPEYVNPEDVVNTE